jgi:hypothetical protein
VRQVFADVKAGDVRGDRPELTAHLRRGGGLKVPEVDVAGAAEQVDDQAGPGAAEVGLLGAAGARARNCGREKPRAVSPPAWRRSRRVKPSPARGSGPVSRSMSQPSGRETGQSWAPLSLPHARTQAPKEGGRTAMSLFRPAGLPQLYFWKRR